VSHRDRRRRIREAAIQLFRSVVSAPTLSSKRCGISRANSANYRSTKFVHDDARAGLGRMSAATVDRYLRPARDRMRLKGVSTTKASPRI
jgi:hypothetical protein